jgi:hypothetical protein
MFLWYPVMDLARAPRRTARKGGFPVLARILLAARCECLHLIKINCLALWLDESTHACTRSELRGASCEDWKSALRRALGTRIMPFVLSKTSLAFKSSLMTNFAQVHDHERPDEGLCTKHRTSTKYFPDFSGSWQGRNFSVRIRGVWGHSPTSHAHCTRTSCSPDVVCMNSRVGAF